MAYLPLVSFILIYLGALGIVVTLCVLSGHSVANLWDNIASNNRSEIINFSLPMAAVTTVGVLVAFAGILAVADDWTPLFLRLVAVFMGLLGWGAGFRLR